MFINNKEMKQNTGELILIQTKKINNFVHAI